MVMKMRTNQFGHSPDPCYGGRETKHIKTRDMTPFQKEVYRQGRLLQDWILGKVGENLRSFFGVTLRKSIPQKLYDFFFKKEEVHRKFLAFDVLPDTGEEMLDRYVMAEVLMQTLDQLFKKPLRTEYKLDLRFRTEFNSCSYYYFGQDCSHLERDPNNQHMYLTPLMGCRHPDFLSYGGGMKQEDIELMRLAWMMEYDYLEYVVTGKYPKGQDRKSTLGYNVGMTAGGGGSCGAYLPDFDEKKLYEK